MQHTLVELERTPDSPTASTQQTMTGKKAKLRLRLYLYILLGTLMIALTSTTFYGGVAIIRQNAKALGFFSLNFDVPLPFLLIGLWSLVVLTMTIFSITTLVKICRLLAQLLHRPAIAQRKTA